MANLVCFVYEGALLSRASVVVEFAVYVLLQILLNGRLKYKKVLRPVNGLIIPRNQKCLEMIMDKCLYVVRRYDLQNVYQARSLE